MELFGRIEPTRDDNRSQHHPIVAMLKANILKGSLSATAVIGAFGPGDYRYAELVSGGPSAGVHVVNP